MRYGNRYMNHVDSSLTKNLGDLHISYIPPLIDKDSEYPFGEFVVPSSVVKNNLKWHWMSLLNGPSDNDF